ncbi:hypothetical protein F8M49_23375 [Rhodococcus zopfii]|uniref:DUF3263 domain-containing protein n=1 Tax=Rhodococcus zopfii TaxID=43772 RepID=A0ABU3WUC6_9NOCA|nr:hypothetical protein [Rhodococcus zopfii]
MTAEDQEFIDFAIKWLPFGGGDEYILPQFGITPNTFYLRLHTLLQSRPTIGLGLAAKRKLVEACAVKLSQRSRRASELV